MGRAGSQSVGATMGEAADMTDLERMYIEHECLKLVHGYCVHYDSEDNAAFVDLWADDAVWVGSAGELTGIELEHIPYKANAQAFQDLVSGGIPMVIGIAATAAPFLKSGKIKVLAVVEKRLAAFPGVPALSDMIPGFEGAPSWTALFGPAKLPPAILRRLNTDILKALATPEVRARDGFELIGESPEAFVERIKREFTLVGKLVKVANIQPTE